MEGIELIKNVFGNEINSIEEVLKIHEVKTVNAGYLYTDGDFIYNLSVIKYREVYYSFEYCQNQNNYIFKDNSFKVENSLEIIRNRWRVLKVMLKCAVELEKSNDAIDAFKWILSEMDELEKW